MTDSLRTRSSDRTWIAAVGAILGAAVWVRLTSLRHVLVGDEVMPMGGDSAYHLHRAMQTAEGFPRVPVHDPLMNWPDGGPCHWAPGFDFLLALPAALTGSTGTSAAVLAAGVPVILGLPLLIVAILLGRRLLPDDAIGRVWLPSFLAALREHAPGVEVDVVARGAPGRKRLLRTGAVA